MPVHLRSSVPSPQPTRHARLCPCARAAGYALDRNPQVPPGQCAAPPPSMEMAGGQPGWLLPRPCAGCSGQVGSVVMHTCTTAYIQCIVVLDMVNTSLPTCTQTYELSTCHKMPYGGRGCVCTKMKQSSCRLPHASLASAQELGNATWASRPKEHVWHEATPTKCLREWPQQLQSCWGTLP